MKTFTKHILLLALMLFGVAGAAWATRAPQKFTGPVDIDNLVQGDTLAPGFSLICNGESMIMISQGNAKVDGNPYESDIYFNCTYINDFSYGPNGAIISGPNTATPAYGDWQDGNAWVVTDAYFDNFEEYYQVTLGGISIDLAPDPYAPALDETTGNWNFLMPGSNKVVKAVLYDSVVLGPHVAVAVQPVQDFISYTRGDSTVLYYDPTLTNSSFGFIANDNDGNGRNFAFWADEQDNHNSDRDFGGFSELTCGQRFVAVYPENHTLTLATPQGGGTLELAGMTTRDSALYDITINYQPQNITAYPYQKVFNFNGDVTSVSGGNDNVSIAKTGQKQVTVTVNRGFSGSVDLSGAEDDGVDILTFFIPVSGTPAGSIQLVELPYGISANNDGTYSVMEGLTVNVTATPDSAHYLSAIDGLDTVSNYACGYSFTMPDDNTELAATFAAKPTLTVTQTDGGTLEAIIPSGAPTTAQLNVTSDWMTDNNGVTASNLPGFVAMTDEEAQAIACPDAEGNVRVIHKLEGDGYLRIIQFSNGVKAGQSSTIARGHSDLYNDCNVTNYKYYYTTGAGTANVIASSTPNTYIIDYGTPVTVVATPDAQHYLVSFSDDATDTNSNVAVEKTYDSVIADIPLQATFQAKPQLTLTANDGGTLTLDGVTEPGAEGTTFTVPGTWQSDNTPLTATDFPGFVPVSQEQALNWQAPASGNYRLFYKYEGGHWYYINFNNGTLGISNYEDLYHFNIYNIQNIGRTIAYTTGAIGGMPAGVVSANATLDTIVVDYGTEVTVVANPDSVHYLATLGGVTMGSNTAKDTTFAVTATTNLAANFAPKPTLTLAHNDGGEMEVIVPEAAPASVTVQFEANGNTVTREVTLPHTFWCYNDAENGELDTIIRQLYGLTGGYCSTPSGTPTASGNDNVTAGYDDYDGYNNHIITISAPFNGTATVEGMYYSNHYFTYSLTISTTTTRANVIASATPNTYYVDYNTSVTVKATPSDTAYLVRFDNDADTNSNTAVEKTYGPLTAALTTAEATFNAKPVLTLAQNESWGTVSVSGPVVWNNQVWGGWDFISTSFPQTVGDITINRSGIYCYSQSGKLFMSNSAGNNPHVTFTSAGDNFTRIEMTYTQGSNLQPASEWTCENGVAVWEGNAQSVSITNATNFYFTQIKFIRGSGIAQLTDTTYRIDYGTTLTVKATPDSAHYLVRFDNDADTNSNVAVEKTYTITENTTATANFAAKPTLTLAQNESDWGTVTMGVATLQNPFTTQSESFTTTGGLTFNGEHFTITGTRNDAGNGIEIGFGNTVTIQALNGEYITHVALHYSYGYHYMNWTTTTSGILTIQSAANSIIENVNASSLTIASTSDKYIQLDQITVYYNVTPPPFGMAQLTDSTYCIDYGATVTVNAQASDLHHVQAWLNQNDDTLQTATYSNYFVTEPENLFPAKSQLTFTMTQDTTAKAQFGLNYRHLTFIHNEGGYMEFVVEQDSMSFTGIETTSVSRDNITITAGQADEEGMYLKAGESSVTIAVAGGAVITQVDFHVTNGTNLVNTISTDAEGATIATTENNEYGSIRGMSAAELTISSSTTHDLQINQFTVHYGNALPNGVAVGPNDSTWYVMPDSTVIVRAIPEEGHYLRSWASTPDQTDSVDALTVSLTVTTDDTLTATFAPNPVIELAVSDAAMGSVYFTDYQGNTVTRAGIIQAQSIALPYRWYEANEIMSIEGGDGMLEKDATSHYLTVNGIFEGTAMVVTSNGAFSVTCEPTLPNGVHYNVADGNYTVLPYTNLSFTATTVSGDYYLVDWAKVTENDSILFDAGMATTTVNIDDDMKILVNFLHNPYTLTLVADTVMGRFDTVAGQEYVKLNADSTAYIVMADSTVAVVAEPKTGYHITSWSNNDGTADSASILMTMDSTITVTFDTNVYSVSYVVDKDTRAAIGTNQRMGTVTLKGRHMHFLNDTLTVRAKYGYTFKGWYNRTNCMSTLDTFVFSPVKDTAFRAKFNVNNYYVSGEAIDTVAGYVTGSDTIAYRESLTLKAVAKTGYHFMNWQDTAGNVLGTVDSLTIQALGDSLVYATFDTNSYNLVVNVAEASTGFGTVAGDTTAKHFVEYQISATADSGYHFVMWTDSVENNPRTVTLTSDSTFTAVFDTNTYHLAVVVDSNCTGRGTVAGDTIAKHFLSYEISATANPGFHFVMWNDSVTTATRTVEPYSDTTFSAIFDYNPALTLVYDKTLGNVNFVVESQSETFTGITDTSLSAGGITVTADSADASGISLKNGKTLTIVADGDNVITQVAFHLTNGANKASSITADHGTVNANDGDAYGAIVEVNSDTLVISSTSTKNINIDQLTIQYAPALPAGVVHLDEDSANVYRVDRNTVVSVNAFPGEGKYLVSWAGDTTSTDDLTAVVTVADSDLTVIANFKNNPVLTLAANGHGRVYFEGYEGYTVNRDEAIQATNLTEFPYTWLESGTISEINGGDGMVVKDNTNHYVSVYGPFDGTATVVTTSGSFTVTCIPTVPNGITVVSDGIYTFEPGTEVSVTAVADEEHYLVNWDDLDSAAALRSIVVNDDTALVANFLHNPYIMTVVADDTTMGTVAPAAGQAYVTANIDGTYTVMADSTVTLVATPDSAIYYVVNWDNDSLLNSDTAVMKAYTVTSDTTVTVHFGKYATLALVAGNGGQVSLAGDTLITGVVATDSTGLYNVVPGTEVALEAVADSFYHFVAWSNDSLTSDITVAVESDTVFTATFDTNTYILVARVMDSCDSCGTVSGTDSAARHFREYTLVAAATPCYHFVNWTDTLGNEVSVNDTLVVSPVSDSIFVANFALNIYVGDTTVDVCDQFTWHDSTYTVTPDTTPIFIYKTANNCDSTVTLHLTIRHSSSYYDTLNVCDSILWNDSVYAATGDYTYTTTNAQSCDSTIMLNLTVRNSTESLLDTTVCERFTWNNVDYFRSTDAHFDTTNAVGCDSIAYLQLTVNYASESNDTVVTCDSVYEWNGFIYTTSTIGIYHTTNQYGCDSTASLYLTLNNNYAGVDVRQACDSLTWVDGVTYYESVDTPTYVYQVQVGDIVCDSTVTLNLTISSNMSSTDVVSACDSMTWIDGVTYSEVPAEAPVYVYHLTSGCDSTVTLELTLNSSIDTAIYDTACTYYIWDGTYYTSSGNYTKRYQTIHGCDSVVTLHLVVNYPTTAQVSETACGSYIWNDIEYSASGAYTQTLVGSNGCDSTVTLALTIKQSVTTTMTVTACDSYTWHDSTYTVTPAVAPTYTTTGGNGCDSTVVLMLTIATSGSSEETVTACDSYTWHDSTYTETPSVAPTYVVTGDNCSTVVTLNLTINHSVENSFDTAACNYFIWEGSYFDQSGSYTKNLDAVNGCDSTVTMTLTINQPVATSFYDTACVSYTWNEVDYTASGAYTQNFSDVNGCDSTVTLRLTIKQPASTSFSAVACDSYEWNDSTYTEGGAYRQTFVAANGCDSVVTLTLTVNQSTTGSETVTTCGSYTWHDSIYTESGVYTYHTTNIAGCDSTVTLTLTIDGIVETSFEDSACVSYSWNDSVYTESGVYRQTFEAVNQCDSIVTLTLTVNQPTAASLTVTACDSYSWHDVTYTETPAVAPTYTTTGSNGCDSVTTLYLTVNYSTSSSENVTACVSYEWNNTEYTVSGVYTFDTVNAMGCDSVATLNLTINQPDSETVTVRACDSYEWNNVEYTVSGVYTFRTTTVAGCDSTATLNLTVNYSADTTLSMIGEGSIVWNEETFYASGTYERVIETVEGCDSNVTLNLIVLPDGFVMPYLYNVMDVVLSINHNEPGHENLHYIYYRWYRNDELVLEGANVDSYSEGGQRLNGCYYLEVAVDENLEYWVRSNTVCIGEIGIDKAEELTFTLAPNPVVYGSIVTVSVNADNADLQGAEIRVYDVNGHEILTQKDDVTIVAEMPSGVYLVRLTLSDGRTGVKRLIVR